MADGSIKIDVDVGIQQAEKQLEDLKKKAQDSGDSVSESMDIDIDNLDKQFQKAGNSIEKTRSKVQALEQQLSEIQNAKVELQFEESVRSSAIQEQIQLNEQLRSGAISQSEFNQLIKENVQDYDNAVASSERLAESIRSMGNEDRLSTQLQNQKGILDNQVISYEMLGNRAEKMSNRIDDASVKASKLNDETKKVDSSMKSASKSSGDMGKNLGMGIKRLGKYALALFSIRTVYQTLRRLSNQWLNSDNAAAKQVNANISAMSQALSNALGPVIQWLANLMAYVFGYVNAILKAFFGIDLLAKNTAKNTGGVASNTKKARKEAEKFSSAFDKADIASSKVADNMDGAGGGGGMDIATPNIPTPDISGFVKFIDDVKKLMKDIWEDETFQSYFDSMVRKGRNSFNLLYGVATNFWANIGNTIQLMLPELERGFDNMIEFYRQMWETIADTTDEWFPKITDSINTFVDSVFETFNPLLVFIAQLWADFWEIGVELWEEYGEPILDNFMKFIDDMINIFNRIWTEIIDPIIQPAIEFVKKLWDEHLKDLVMEFGRFIGDLILGAQEIWNEVFKPIIDWIVTKVGPIFKWLAETIFPILGYVFGDVADTIKNIIKDLRQIFGGFIDFIVGVFTGDWGRAWQGVKDIFSGIVSGLANIFKLPINWIIDGINAFLRGLNRIKIPNWVPVVGGKGFNIAPIPRLAQGTYVTGGAMTAIVGEAGKEAVVPLENNTEWIHDFLNLANANGGLGGGGTNVTNVILDGSVLATATSKEESKRNVLLNGVLA